MVRFPRALGSLGCSIALLATGCAALPDTARMIADGQTFPMQPGEQVVLSDHGALHYVGVVSDSRCPPAVQCILAGNAVIALRWTTAGGAAEDFDLSTPDQPRAHDLGRRRLTLLSLARGPAPQATLRIALPP